MSLPSTGGDCKSLRTGIPRWVEVGLALFGLVLLSPVFVVVAVGIRLTSPGPVVFRQRRVGRGGVEFMLLKFRTMQVNADPQGVTAHGDSRITPLGRWLRLLKLDEMPELWNVARGDMSLVGPRPEVPRYVDATQGLWRCVLQVRPGLTDPVTLRLRNEEQLLAAVAGDTENFYLKTLQPYKLSGYIEYLERRSFASDVGVLARTLLAVTAPSVSPPPSVEEVRATVRGLDERHRGSEPRTEERG